MTALRLSVFFLFIILIGSAYAEQHRSVSNEQTTASMLQLCFDLWSRSNFGWNQSQIGKGAWVIRNSYGQFQWIDWKYFSEDKGANWKGTVPKGVIAQVHTHSALDDPQPSKKDLSLAEKIDAPVYIVSGVGIWSIDPSGKITQEADGTWHRKIKH